MTQDSCKVSAMHGETCLGVLTREIDWEQSTEQLGISPEKTD